jgi:enoyl-CoA hydratase
VLRVERRAGTTLLTIARPETKNALDAKTMEALASAVRDVAEDGRVRAVVVTGEGDAFVSGGDLRELAGKHSREDAERFADAGSDLCDGLAGLTVPVIAALPGVAFGGGAELAVACDLRVADRRARLSWKQARMGVTTAWGTLGRIVALVGEGAAARLLYTAQEVSAEDALRMGLLDAVCEDGHCVDTALAWADDVARGAPEAVARLKALVRGGGSRARQRESFVETWSGPDHVEAVEAYVARRRPVWRPRGE